MQLCACRTPDVGPEEPRERLAWMLSKVVKATGAAKLMVVRLEAVKHQETLSYLTACRLKVLVGLHSVLGGHGF